MSGPENGQHCRQRHYSAGLDHSGDDYQVALPAAVSTANPVLNQLLGGWWASLASWMDA